LGGVKIKARDKLIGSHITFGNLWDKATRGDGRQPHEPMIAETQMERRDEVGEHIQEA
jgi:hypothetical protein